jgi:hypothetical protein
LIRTRGTDESSVGLNRLAYVHMDLFSPNFGRPTVFVDPRRVMFSVRTNLGR